MARSGAHRKQKRVSWATRLLTAAAIVCALAAAYFLASEYLVKTTYSRLADEVGVPAEAQIGQASIDWAALRARNSELAAWLSIDGTPISVPVVEPTDDRSGDYYLSHDFDGNSSYLGCAYIDMRTSAASAHLLVYGHNNGGDVMFSPLSDTYTQAGFDAVGTAHWLTEKGGELTFSPLFAMRVDASYMPVQTFAFADADGLRTWVRAMSRDASAASSGWEAMLEASNRVLITVTCPTTQQGETERVLLVFAAHDPAFDAAWPATAEG